jgi:hypothetical protein
VGRRENEILGFQHPPTTIFLPGMSQNIFLNNHLKIFAQAGLFFDI